MSGRHADVEKEDTRLRKDVRLRREEREMQKSRQSSVQAKAGEVRLYRCLEARMTHRVFVLCHAGNIPWLSGLEGSPNEPETAR